jgi:hypothetical protein
MKELKHGISSASSYALIRLLRSPTLSMDTRTKILLNNLLYSRPAVSC